MQPSAGLPKEVQSLETQTISLLFDRNTQTQYTAYADSSITAELEKATEIRAIKLHGAAPYTLNVRAYAAGGWTPVAGLQKLDLTKLGNGWNTLNVTQPVTASRLLFVLTPDVGNKAGTTPALTGINELEIWAQASTACCRQSHSCPSPCRKRPRRCNCGNIP